MDPRLRSSPWSKTMSESSSKRLSRYTLQARIAPALLAASPALALGLSVLPLVEGAERLWSLLALGLTTYSALVARKGGNRVQPTLWATWGGAPTARRLRYREGVSHAAVSRRHRDIERALGDSFSLPTAAEEAADPYASDAEYQQSVRRFISTVREDPAYPLVHVENRNYGFARNLYGLKPLALTCAVGVLATSVMGALAIGIADRWANSAPLVLPGLVSIVALMLWKQVDAEYVRPSAEAYADRLLEAAQHRAKGS